ncbi:MAG: NYN domain-containing protein [Firmicutes bacterium]|nr:NYN domain-containing protein [Bacillota bacterium]
MDQLTVAILAHVDAGKTTTAEAMLYRSGTTRTLGRVDHKDAFLDTHFIERQRGITIFSKQAVLELDGQADSLSGAPAGPLRVFLLDTPGHADFSAETERVLSVPDCALLVISGPDGVQAHTKTLWQLLSKYRIPTFVWVNKMDICAKSRGEVLEDLSRHFGEGFFDFSQELAGGIPAADLEAVAALSESTIEEFLETGALSEKSVRGLIKRRRVFPCFFGSALRLEGVDGLLSGIRCWAPRPVYPQQFGARVFKITHDQQNNRLTWIKVTGGSLKVRDTVGGSDKAGEKITQIRIYSGTKFTTADEVPAGTVAAVLGLSASYAGQGLGFEKDSRAPLLEPVLSYRIGIKDGTDPMTAFAKLQQLAEEDPQLRIIWDSRLKEIHAQFMGRIQAEVLTQLISDRFGIDTEIGAGEILYRETIAAPVEGVGHFEPLRHYAEVHVLLEPLPLGSGLVFESAVSTDDLDINWQRLIMGSLMGKQHLGVLTGSPLTDVRITLVAGRAHLKHTEGGDFREAAGRAVRNALMRAQNVLLEPFYAFRIELPAAQIGRAISDLRAMQTVFSNPQDMDGSMQISGRAPVSEMADYQPVFLSYTRGQGQLSLRSGGYYPCHDTEKVIQRLGYEPERDTENPADSVFCSHGSGVIVKWDHVREFMHMDSGIRIVGSEEEPQVEMHAPKLRSGGTDIDEKELEAIMQREFGPIKRPKYSNAVYNRAVKPASGTQAKKDYIIVDGYNMIFAWDELSELAKDDISAARDRLINMLSDYQGLRGIKTVLVFDGYKVRQGAGSGTDEEGLGVVYTKEGETADAYIQRLVHEIGKNYNVRVASSDGMVQLFALRSGVLRMSAPELYSEVQLAREEIQDILDDQGRTDTFSNNPRQV